MLGLILMWFKFNYFQGILRDETRPSLRITDREYSGYCDVIIYHYFPSKLE